MSDNANALTAQAALLRQKAQRLEELARRQEAIDNELAAILGGQVETVKIPAPRPTRFYAPQEGIITQRSVITDAIRANGPQTRQQLFARLQEQGKAPTTANQLSAILNRGQKKGWVVKTASGTWALPPTMGEQSP